jgi:hypothetical protein
MTRFTLLASTLFLTLSFSAFGQIIDPNVGFCPPPGSQATCTTANGLGGETIGVGTTSFALLANGAQDSNAPWFLLVAVPDDVGGTPKITSSSFTQQGTTQDAGAFKSTNSGDIYAFTSADTGGLTGDNSMNATNMFGANEVAAFGGTPSSFELFVYAFDPGLTGKTAYTFASSGLTDGTFLAAVGIGGGTKDNIQFSTPFTTAGLVDGPTPTPTPEPASVVLLAMLGLMIGSVYRKKTRLNN